MVPDNPSSSIQCEALIMGGPFKIILVGGDEQVANDLISYLRHLENLWTRFSPDSEIMQLNWAQGRSVVVSEETTTLVSQMVSAYELTNGMFDPTTLPQTLLNGYQVSRVDSTRTTRLPQTARWPGDVAGIRVDVINRTVTLPEGTTLDAGGIGKGLSADLGIEFAFSRGVTGALISANGDVRVAGDAPDGDLWRVGIEHPLNRDLEIDQLSFREGAVVTSSRVHNVWQKDGVTTHHLVDTQSGQASSNSVLTASVFARTAAQGEVLAKVPFMCDIGSAFDFVISQGAQLCIVDEHMNMHRSAGWPGMKNE